MADQTSNYEVLVTETGAKEVRRNIEDVGTGAEKASKGVDLLGSTLKLLGGYLGVSKLISYSDGYQQITNQLKYATKSLQEYKAVEQALFDVSQRTYSSFDANSKLFQRMVVATGNLGTSYKDLLGFITTVNQAFALSKLSTQEASNSLIQLAQGMAKGVLNGDELRTVLESAPILADALAKGLNTTTGALRKMGETGELTTKRVMDALQKQAPRLSAEFAKLVPTIGQGWQVLSNAMERWIGQTSQTTGAGAAISKVLQYLGNNIEMVTNVLGLAIGVWLSYRAALLITALVQGVVTAITVMNAAIGASAGVLSASAAAMAVLRGAMTGLAIATGLNPFTIIVVTLTALIGIVYLFGNSIKVNFAGTISLTAALTLAFNYLKSAVSTLLGWFQAGAQWIYQHETALNFLKMTVVLATAAFLAMTVVKIVGFFTSATIAVVGLAGSFMALMFWPAVVIGGLLSIGYIIAYLTGNVENFKARIVAGFNSVKTEAEKLTTQMLATTNGNNEATNSLQKLLEKSFGAASALGTVNTAAKGAATSTHELHQHIHGINTDAEPWLRFWDGLIHKFHDWQMETRNFNTTFDEWHRHLTATQALERYIALETEAGNLTKDWQKHVSELGDSFDYQVGALGRLDDALAKTSGSYNNLSKSADSASASTSSVTKSTQSPDSSASHGKTQTQSPIMQFAENFYPTVGFTRMNNFAGSLATILTKASGMSATDGNPIDSAALQDLINTTSSFAFRGAWEPDKLANIKRMFEKWSQGSKDWVKTQLPWVPMRTGGSFEVGGQGSPDSQLVQFLASPNERVTVERPEQVREREKAATGNRPIVVNMNVTTPDSDSFRRSETQTLTSLQSRIRRATR